MLQRCILAFSPFSASWMSATQKEMLSSTARWSLQAVSQLRIERHFKCTPLLLWKVDQRIRFRWMGLHTRLARPRRRKWWSGFPKLSCRMLSELTLVRLEVRSPYRDIWNKEKKLIEAVYGSEIMDNIIGSVGGRFPKSMVPLQRAGSVEDIAGAVLFLTSKAGTYLSSSVIVTDGGRLSVLPSSYWARSRGHYFYNTNPTRINQ